MPDPTVEEIDFDSAPATDSDASTVDTDALLSQEGNWSLSDLAGLSAPSDLLAHETSVDFAPDALDARSDSPFAGYLGRGAEPEEAGADTAAPVAPATPVTPANAEALADPGLAEIARSLGMTPEELMAGAPEVPATPAAPSPADTTPVPAAPSPEVAALMEQIGALRQTVESLQSGQSQAQLQEAAAQAQAQAQAQRTAYEQEMREAYEARFEHMEDEDRASTVGANLRADMLEWDAAQAQATADAQAQQQAQAAASAQQEAAYQSVAEKLVGANPTMGLEVAEGYRITDFLADSHRASTFAYGDVGPFEPYAKAFEAGLKSIQTKSFQAGIAHAQARTAKGAASPPVLSNKGGGGAPVPPKGGPAKLDLNKINFFAPQGKERRN